MVNPPPSSPQKPTPPAPSFNEFEHLQDVLMRTHNKDVRDGFKDDIADDDKTTPEGALRYACLLKDNDNATSMILRILLFNLVRGDNKIIKDIADKFYGIPVLDHHRDVKFAPQVILKFKEKRLDAKKAGRQSSPVRMRVSFRLPRIAEDSINKNDLIQWGNKIRELFPPAFYHTIGFDRFSYRDSEKGLGFLIRSVNKTDAIELFRKLITLLEYTRTSASSLDKIPYRFDALKIVSHKDDEVKTAKTVTLSGLQETYKLPMRYKSVKVWLYRAELHLHGRLSNKDLMFRDI
jgi:hypothetical protein